MDAIVLIGGGGHAKVVISILRKLDRHRILGYTDMKNNGALSGAPYLGTDDDLTALVAGPEKLTLCSP
jgi:UDP-perosamine 4-acetyltransferase